LRDVTSYSQKGGVCTNRGGITKKGCSYEGCDNGAVKAGVCITHGAKVMRKRVPHITSGKEEFVRDIAWKVTMQLISHRTEKSLSFLLSCLVDQLIMKMRRNLFMDLEGLMLLV